MCNSLPLRASRLRPRDDAASVVECLRPWGEHEYSICLTLTPLCGPQEGPRRSQGQPNTTHTQPSASSASWRQTGEAYSYMGQRSKTAPGKVRGEGGKEGKEGGRGGSRSSWPPSGFLFKGRWKWSSRSQEAGLEDLGGGILQLALPHSSSNAGCYSPWWHRGEAHPPLGPSHQKWGSQ